MHPSPLPQCPIHIHLPSRLTTSSPWAAFLRELIAAQQMLNERDRLHATLENVVAAHSVAATRARQAEARARHEEVQGAPCM